MNTKTIILLLIATIISAETAQAKILNIQDVPFSAAADGTTDDRPALSRAFAAAESGDVVFVPPGTYRMVLTGGALKIPENITLLGQREKSKFILSSNGTNSDYREFLLPKTGVTVEGITIERDTDFPGILIPISGDASDITLRNCHIIGGKSHFPETYIHAFRVGYGTVKNLTFDGITVEDCSYGLFQPNNATGTLDGVTVQHSIFKKNTSSDLEFNSPNGTMRNIIVRECFFRDNLCNSPSAGFAVGFANVKGGRIESCHVRNYRSEALHVEDRSSKIEIVGNTIIGGSTVQPNGVIMVLSGSKNVSITDNFIDGRPNTNKVHLILVTGGGRNFTCPSEVSVNDNTLIGGPLTKTWYLQNGSGPAPQGNHIISAN